MDGGKKSGSQKLFTGLASPSTAGRMEAESRTWMVRCPNCGYERSVWDTGGVRYKAAGTSYWLRRCPNCGKVTWHKVYRPTGPAAAIPAQAVSLSRTSRLPRWLLWVIVLGVLAGLVVVFLAVLIIIISSFTQPVVKAGDDFMTALRTGDYTQAYNLSTPDLQKEVGSASGLAAIVQGNAAVVQDQRPAQWSWTSRSLSNGVGQLDGTLTYSDGKPGTVHLVLQQVGNDWKIESFSLNPG